MSKVKCHVCKEYGHIAKFCKNKGRMLEGKPCLTERDRGKCEVEGCKAQHDVTAFTHRECNTKAWKEFGVCLKFNHGGEGEEVCPHKHPLPKKRRSREETIAALKAAEAKYPEEKAGGGPTEAAAVTSSAEVNSEEDRMNALIAQVMELEEKGQMPKSTILLMDGGSFSNLWGTMLLPLLKNRRKVTPIEVDTPNGKTMLEERARPS